MNCDRRCRTVHRDTTVYGISRCAVSERYQPQSKVTGSVVIEEAFCVAHSCKGRSDTSFGGKKEQTTNISADRNWGDGHSDLIGQALRQVPYLALIQSSVINWYRNNKVIYEVICQWRVKAIARSGDLKACNLIRHFRGFTNKLAH